MAKAKNPTVKSEEKAAAPKAPARKKSKPAPPRGSPLVDTNLAAQTAARLIAAKPAASAEVGKKQSSAFRQLKDSLAKGHATGVQSVLNNTMAPGAKKSSLPFASGKQVGHNQTFGSDASRNFVPRRTSG
jgi:hypothetical protein